MRLEDLDEEQIVNEITKVSRNMEYGEEGTARIEMTKEEAFKFLTEREEFTVYLFQVIPQEYRNDVEFMKSLAPRLGATAAVRFASKDLQNDRAFIGELVKEYGSEPLQYLGKDLSQDSEFIKEVLSYNKLNASLREKQDALFRISCRMNDFGVGVNKGVLQDKFLVEKFLETGMSLHEGGRVKISPEIRKDPEYVVELIKKYGNRGLELADNSICTDKRVIMASVGNVVEAVKSGAYIDYEAIRNKLVYAEQEARNEEGNYIANKMLYRLTKYAEKIKELPSSSKLRRAIYTKLTEKVSRDIEKDLEQLEQKNKEQNSNFESAI